MVINKTKWELRYCEHCHQMTNQIKAIPSYKCLKCGFYQSIDYSKNKSSTHAGGKR